MSLIIMAVFDTEANGRTKYTEQALVSLLKTVDFTKHRLFISDNGSCHATHDLYQDLFHGDQINNIQIKLNGTNLGTAGAVNLGIRTRLEGQHIIKIDNDCVVNQSGWVEEMEEVITRDETIGIVGLKRKDLIQNPYHENPQFRSELIMLPHEAGQRWISVEKTNDIMGTCTMISSKLLYAVGYFFQPSKYGFDDVLMSLRSSLSGFKNVFIPHIDISHVDDGSGSYSEVKQNQASEVWDEYGRIHNSYVDGTRPLYYDGGFK